MSEDNKNLATIQQIVKLEPIEKADSIEVATVLGWQSVVKKGIHKMGDLVIFIQIDTVLPNNAEWASFLKDKNDPSKPIRLKTARLRGQVSQGICLPISLFNFANPKIGDDVTELLGVTKYVKELHASLAGCAKGGFPSFLKKTDEDLLQNYPKVINEIVGRECYATLKLDGSSGTYYFKDGQFGVCSRNLDLIETEGNGFWRMAAKYDLRMKFRELNKNFAVQGEVVGPGIQKNPLGLKEPDLYLFNIFDIDKYAYLSYRELLTLATHLNLKLVPVFWRGIVSKEMDIKSWVELASTAKYENGSPAEGIVVRSIQENYSEAMRGRLSFKVLNPNYKDN